MSDRLILGTAGHIDHGKTSLVKALTGVDCDRLPEEKTRGITIELGFAPLDLPSGRRLGIVDVPGHERLVRTMVAGATGIDLVLFVVAADEGIMPQSREHLSVCALLGVESGVVALTKTDAVDAELVELARLEIEEELRDTPLSSAPVIPVSAVTGRGLEELRTALDAAAAGGRPRTLRDGPAWLCVDRTFTMRGFGTVVTGTLRGAELEEGMLVEVLPEGSGERLQSRLRGLQVHGDAVPRASPGSRCGMNLQGLEVAAVPRGSVVATPGRLARRPRCDVELELLPGAPPLESGTSLTVHVGTAERLARLRLLDRARLAPGERGFAELRFASPLVAVEGDRFIVRGFRRIAEAGWTFGGGRILDVAPPGRRAREARVADLEALASGERARVLGVHLARSGMRGIRERDLRLRVRSLEGIDGVRTGADRWLSREALAELARRAVAAVEAHHGERPADPWVGLAAVTSRLPPRLPEETVRAALAAAVEDGELESGESGVRRPGHAAHASDPELEERLLERLRDAGLAPPTLDAFARETEASPADVRTLAQHLVREGKLVRVTAGLFFARDPLADLETRLVDYLREHGQIDPSAYKTLTGQTRKHTVPLMEYFDTRKLTVRRGNVRVLRGASG